MEILENRQDWETFFHQNWLAHLKKTGETDWSRYQHPRNSEAPGTSGVRLANTRLLLVTSAGAYLPDSMPPFAEEDLYGDYSVRTFPSEIDPSRLAYAHGHYDATMITEDPQVGIPLGHLRDLVQRGRLGSIASKVVTFMGYQPDSARVVDEVVPAVVEIAKEQAVQAALLAPL